MSNGSHHAYFMTNWMSGSMMDLGTAGGTNSEAYCINSNRMVVGYAMMSGMGALDPKNCFIRSRPYTSIR